MRYDFGATPALLAVLLNTVPIVSANHVISIATCLGHEAPLPLPMREGNKRREGSIQICHALCERRRTGQGMNNISGT